MPTITINGVSLNPEADSPSLAARRMLSADARQSDYILIQTRRPLDRRDRAALLQAGAEILEYVPEDAYICRYPGTSLAKIKALEFVAWAHVYLEAFKVSPTLFSHHSKASSGILENHARVSRRSLDKPKAVQVVLHRSANLRKVAAELAGAAGVSEGDIRIHGNRVYLTVDPSRFPKIAAIDAVRHIEPDHPYRLHNDVARKLLRVVPESGMGSGSGSVLEGKDQIIAVCDTGLDKGSKTNVHPAFKGRVKKLYSLGRSRSNDPDGHGTHVAGSVLGEGKSNTLGIEIRGTAPKAKLVFQSVLDPDGGLGGIPLTLSALLDPPYSKDKARIHTNSWGLTGSFGDYTAEAHDVDGFVWEHRDLLVCFSAGNEGTDQDGNGQVNPRSVTPPGTARNCLTVGASENLRPDKQATWGEWWPTDFPVAPIRNDRLADNPEGIAAFSGRGPTTDGRIKPDLVAPGSFILSARSRDTVDEGWELSGDPLYFFLGGTSMATPLVAGCAAIVREHLIRIAGIPNPAASLIKGVLINGARDLQGQYSPSEAPSIPNHHEGFGRVDVSRSLRAESPGGQLLFLNEKAALDTGEEFQIPFEVRPATKLLKVTLVWTDPPGEALQNDLDLSVKIGTSRRNGNQPGASSKFDRRNNVEQVLWKDPPAGTAIVLVRAFRITRHPQDFALVLRSE